MFLILAFQDLAEPIHVLDKASDEPPEDRLFQSLGGLLAVGGRLPHQVAPGAGGGDRTVSGLCGFRAAALLGPGGSEPHPPRSMCTPGFSDCCP